MKITRDHPDQLILEKRPWLFVTFLIVFMLIFMALGLPTAIYGNMIGLLFVLGGVIIPGIAFVTFVRRTMVVFDRPANSIEIRRKSILGITQDIYKISDLIGAIVTTVDDHNYNSKTSRCELEMKNGTNLPLALIYTGGSGARRTAEKVNAWLCACP